MKVVLADLRDFSLFACSYLALVWQLEVADGSDVPVLGACLAGGYFLGRYGPDIGEWWRTR